MLMGVNKCGQQKRWQSFQLKEKQHPFFVVKVALQELIPRQLLALIEQFSTS